MLRAIMILAAPTGFIAAATALLMGGAWYIAAIAYVVAGMSGSAVVATMRGTGATMPEENSRIDAQIEQDLLAIETQRRPRVSEIEAEYIEGRDAVRLQLRAALTATPMTDGSTATVAAEQARNDALASSALVAAALPQVPPGPRQAKAAGRSSHHVQ